MSNDVLIALISTLGGITVAYITVKYKDMVVKKITRQPKDRMETIFDGYENLIQQQQQDIDRKVKHIGRLESIIDRLEMELLETKSMLNEAKNEARKSQSQNIELQAQLKKLRKEYG